jgi:hypothetical protein
LGFTHIGASTLIGNLIRTTLPTVPGEELARRRKPTLANRRWLRHYADGVH